MDDEARRYRSITLRVFAFGAALTLLLWTAMGQACTRRPSPPLTQGAQGAPREVSFVYAHAGQPATNLRVLQYALDGSQQTTSTGDTARLSLSPGTRLVVEDPAADGVILMTFEIGEEVPARIDVPEAVRITGRVPPEMSKPVTLLYGYGRRVKAGQRFRRDYDRSLVETEEENRVLGMELPSGAETWDGVAPGVDGAFTTPWLPATDVPQLIAFNAAGQAAVEDVPLGAVTPRATLEAPALRFRQTKRLDIDFANAPAASVAADAQVYLRGVQMSAEDRAFIERYVSVLDQIDVHAFAFATLMRPFTLASGRTTLSFLPPWTAVDLRLMGAIMGPSADVNVPMAADVTPLKVDGRQVLPQAGSTLPLHGTVVLEHTYALMPGAKVVYSCFPEKYETVTDRHGNFVIPQACVGRELTLFVSAEDRTRPPRFAPTQTTRTLVHQAGQIAPVVITLPERNIPFAGRPALPLPTPADLRPETLAAARASQLPHAAPFDDIIGRFASYARPPLPPHAAVLVGNDWDDPDPQILVFNQNGQSLIENFVVETQWINKPVGQLRARVSEGGFWNVRAALSPCVVGVATAQQFSPNAFINIQLAAQGKQRPKVMITVFEPNSSNPAKGIEVSMPSVIEDPDPLVEETNEQGVVTFESCWIDSIDVFIADLNAGYFEGTVYLDQRGYGMVSLQRFPPWNRRQVNPDNRAPWHIVRR